MELGSVGTSSDAVGALYWIVTVLFFGSLFVLVGGGVVLGWCWRQGWERAGVRRSLWSAWAVLLASTVVSVVLQEARGAGIPVSRALHASSLGSVLRSRYGVMSLVMVALLVVAGGLLNGLSRWDPGRGWTRRVPRWWLPSWSAAGLGMLVSATVAGHGGSGRWVVLGAVVGAVHLSSASVWLGGLVLLTLALFAKEEPEQSAIVARNVSSAAFWAVVVVVATGLVQSVRQVGVLSAITGSSFGLALVAKTALVCVLVALGALSRRLVHGSLALPRPRGRSRGSGAARLRGELRGGGLLVAVAGEPLGPLDAGRARPAVAEDLGPRERYVSRVRRDLRRLVLAELVISVTVLGATATLVEAVPPR